MTKGTAMKIPTKMLVASVVAVFLLAGCETQPDGPSPAQPKVPEAAPAADKLPVNDVRDGVVPNWHVMSFTVSLESDRNQPEEKFIRSFKRDYLASLGGEANAVLTEGTVVAYKDETGADRTAEIELSAANSIGWLSSEWDEALFGRKIAYANCLLKSDKDQTVKCYFGSGDEAQVWVNGKLVHEIYDARNCEPRSDRFTVELKKGLNPLMVKGSQRSQNWEFVLEVYPAE